LTYFFESQNQASYNFVVAHFIEVVLLTTLCCYIGAH